MTLLMLMRVAWVAAIVAAILTALYGVYAYVEHSGYDRCKVEWDADTAREVKAQLEKNIADAAKLKKLEEKANVESQDNLRLRANNHALWLRLPKTPCVGSGASGGDTTAGTGELPTAGESYLAGAKRQLDDEALRADELVRACRVLNEFLK